MRFHRLLTAAAILAISVTAHADTFSFSLSGPSDNGSGIITAAPTGTPGEFLITAITGTFDGSAIAALLPVGTFPSSLPPENDNLFFYPDTAGAFDESGVSFVTASALDVNIFYGYFTSLSGLTTGPDYFVVEGTDTVNDVTSFTATDPTPEPSSILLVGSGLLGLTAAIRRRITS